MDRLRQMRFRFRQLFRRGAREREMEEEMQAHLAASAAANVALGMSDEDAAAAAARAFGGSLRAKELCRDEVSFPWLGQLAQDLRYVGRSLRTRPGFAAIVIAVVALGIGATTAAFSVADFVLLRPLPYAAPDRLVKVWASTPAYSRLELSPPNFRDWRQGAHAFASLGAYYQVSSTLRSGRDPKRVLGYAVTADLFPTLGVAPLLGRPIGAAEDQPGAARVIVLSYGFWKSEFGGASDVVGRQVILDEEACTIIGVMPPQFNFPISVTQFWEAARFGAGEYADSNRDNNQLRTIGRLRPGVTIEQARAEIAVQAAQTRLRFPRENRDVGGTVVALGDEISDRSRLLLWALVGAAGCLLLIACANLGSLLIARALSRKRELCLRVALGASRGRIARQLLTETLALAFLGGPLGVVLAAISIPLLSQLVPNQLPLPSAPPIDLRVLLVALFLTVGAGLVFGLAPLIRLRDLTALRDSTRVAGGPVERLRSVLIAAEIAGSIVLLVATGLLARALISVQHVDPGFDPSHVYTIRTELPLPDYNPVVRRETFYQRVLEDVRALPQVQSAAWISFLPLSNFRGGIWTVSIPSAGTQTGSPSDTACLRYVTPGFFQTLGIPLRQGRDVAARDTQTAPRVAVISESFARHYWPNANPIGRSFNFAFEDREVVGVVGDVRFRGLERESEPQVYLPSSQVYDGALIFFAPRSLAVRASGPLAPLSTQVRQIIRRADPRLPLTEEKSMEDWIAEDTATRSTQVSVLCLFAGAALILAAVGIHGLLSFSVAQREKEIGVRRALGAQRGDILRLVMKRVALLAVAGALPGVYLAYLTSRVLQSLLAGVQPTDAISYGLAVTLCLAMAALGSLGPSWRAVRIDPAVALRAE